MRRKDGSVGFYRKWDIYKKGFGDVTGEFWLGTYDRPIGIPILDPFFQSRVSALINLYLR